LKNNTIILYRDPTSYERYNRISTLTMSVITTLWHPNTHTH